jgi:metal-sulfur cluster biosynthetic enzyme
MDADDAPMFDNPAPIVYERAAASGADGDIEDDNNAATTTSTSSLAAGARLPASRAAALAALRRSAAAFESPGAWEAAFDPLVAGVGASGAETKAATQATTPTPPTAHRRRTKKPRRDPIDAAEVFDLVRDIRDPEHPYTLEQLNVVSRSAVRADDAKGIARVDVTPTVDHCSMATLIGLCVKARLEEALPPRFKVRVRLAPGSHATEEAVNRQLADKERVAAAMENARLRSEVERCLAPPGAG